MQLSEDPVDEYNVQIDTKFEALKKKLDDE